jgi:Domain of unknown function (DUF4352)
MMTGPTPAEEPPRPTAGWVGRASVPEQRPVDPYWPPVDADEYPPPGYMLVPVGPRPRRTGLRIAAVVTAMFALCCVGGASLALFVHKGGSTPAAAGPVPTTVPPVRTTAPRTPAATRSPSRPGQHAPVQDGKFEFVVGSLSCGHPSVNQSVVSRSAEGQFCLLELTVRNISSQSQSFADTFQKAIGPGGVRYGADTAAGVIVNASGTAVWSVINPGNQVSGTIVFDIPKTASIATVELHDSLLSHGVTVAVG